MKLTKQQEEWVERHKRYGSKNLLRKCVISQKAQCAFSKVKMFFDKTHGTPPCHPLYASIDHTIPGNPQKLKIVCYALNDLKGFLPENCFIKTKGWKLLMRKWQNAKKNKANRKTFIHLLRPNT